MRHGADLSGKDGPMKAVGDALIQLHVRHQRGLPLQAKNEHPETSASVDETTPRRVRGEPGLQVDEESVAVDALATESGAALKRDLEALGLEKAAVAGRIVSGRLPIAAIAEAAAVNGLQSLTAAAGGGGVGSVTTEGDVSLQTDEVRSDLGVDGSGVKTCVLSDSHDNPSGSVSTTASDDIESGDLPGSDNPDGRATPIDVRDDGRPGLDEGRAMLQIVHDIAPGSLLGFHTTLGGLANYANAIDELADPNQGNCDVIVDDYIYFAEGMLQDGVVAQAVKNAVRQDDVIYLTFAGNAGDRSYESQFRRSGREISSLACCPNKSGEMHDFDPSAAVDVRQEITLSAGASPNLSLQWTDPYLNAENDLDLFLIDPKGDNDPSNDEVVASSESANVGAFAVETIFTYTNSTGSPQTLDLVVTLTDDGEDQAPDLIKWVDVLNSGRLANEYVTESGTSFGHRNVLEAITVGAAAWFNTPDVPPGSNVTPDDPPVLNAFSSKGGVPIYFDETGYRLSSPQFRSKPDITATDGGENTFFGSDSDNDGTPNFFGTSAAAPHAAGVVALMLERDETLSASQVKERLQASALDITERSSGVSIPNGQGDDIFSGAGLVQADAAAPLPVELTRWEGVVVEGGGAAESTVRLRWQTASEASNAGFRVQRRAEGGSWTDLQFVEGAGTTSEPQTYRFTDADLPYAADSLRYRLKQIDTDGTTSLSDPITIGHGRPAGLELLGTAPNPASRQVTVRYGIPEATASETRGPARLRLYDLLGRQVRSVRLGGSGTVAGRHKRGLDVSGLAPGTYVLRLEARGQAATRKVTVVR
jgi:hypothetical protein